MKKFLFIFLSIFLISLTSAVCYDYSYGTAKTRVCGDYIGNQITFRCDLNDGNFGILYISDSEISCTESGCQGSPSSSPTTITVSGSGQKWATCWTNNADYWVYANMYFNYNVICTSGQERCEGQTHFICSNNGWGSPALIDGECGYTAPICSNGQEKCEGTTLSTCYNNVWTNRGQVDGKCGYIALICTTNQERCNENFLEICENNAWVSHGQVNGKCGYVTPNSCSDGIKNGDETGIDCGGTQNCPTCQWNTCGDGTCQSTETSTSCPSDCSENLISFWNKVLFEKWGIQFTPPLLLTIFGVLIFLLKILRKR